MLSLYNFILVVSTIWGAQRLRRYIKEFSIYDMISLVKILIQIFIAFKFPLLFVSWIVFSDSLSKDIIQYLYKKDLIKLPKQNITNKTKHNKQ